MIQLIVPIVLALAAGAAQGQAWPTKPARIVVAFAPGGSLGSPEQFARVYREDYEKYGRLVKELNIKIN